MSYYWHDDRKDMIDKKWKDGEKTVKKFQKLIQIKKIPNWKTVQKTQQKWCLMFVFIVLKIEINT